MNDPQSPVIFDGFDCCDLGLEIKLSNGFRWHLAWKDEDFHQIGTGTAELEKYHSDFVSTNCTDRWLQFSSRPLSDIKIVYVNEEWKIPSRCILTFDDGQKITVLLAKELNLDESLPQPLEYVSYSEIYVFFGEDIPPHRDVRLELPPLIKKTVDHTQKKELSKSFGETQQSVSSTVLIGLLLLFVIIVIWLQTT